MAGLRCDVEAGMAKLFASETALELATEAMRIHGGVGYTADLPVERYYLARPEQRRVLIVISDGAPVDQATLENNADRELLDRHLRQVIAEIEGAGGIELAAIGVKHDVDGYYRNSVRIAEVEGLGASLVAMIDTLLR